MDNVDGRAEFERLQALHRTGLLNRSAPPEFEVLCREARDRFAVAMALVTLIDRDVQIIKTAVGTDLAQTPRRDAFCDWTIRADDVFVVPDTLKDPRFAENPLVTGEPFIRFYAGAPLTYLDGIRLGALCLLDPKPRDFSLGDRAELAALADQVVTVVAQREFATLPGRSPC